VSGKVDVWSLGVIFYQMLFGKRPFGEGKSQQSLLQDRTMLRATIVEFPALPKCSEAAKDFIRTALRHSHHERPEVRQLCEHAYVKKGP